MPATRVILCDSCGNPAMPEHIRERMARLELATRFRPVHIGLLLVTTAPPAPPNDNLYAWEQQAASPHAAQFLRALIQVLGTDSALAPTAQLADLQRRGIYLARLVECPLEPGISQEKLAARYGPVLVKRITYSYKPRQIVLLAPVAPGLTDLLRAAGLGEKLIQAGEGIAVPLPDDTASVASLRTSLAPWTGFSPLSGSAG